MSKPENFTAFGMFVAGCTQIGGAVIVHRDDGGDVHAAMTKRPEQVERLKKLAAELVKDAPSYSSAEIFERLRGLPSDLDAYRALAAQAQAVYDAQPFRGSDEIEQFQDPDDETDAWSDWKVAANAERLDGRIGLRDDIAERVPDEQTAAFIAQSFDLIPRLAAAVRELTAELEEMRAP